MSFVSAKHLRQVQRSQTGEAFTSSPVSRLLRNTTVGSLAVTPTRPVESCEARSQQKRKGDDRQQRTLPLQWRVKTLKHKTPELLLATHDGSWTEPLTSFVVGRQFHLEGVEALSSLAQKTAWSSCRNSHCAHHPARAVQQVRSQRYVAQL